MHILILHQNGLHDFDDRLLFETLGRRDPRGVPDSVISGLPSGTYGEWAIAGETEDHCPICFDEVRFSGSSADSTAKCERESLQYSTADPVLKLPRCNHWFHKPCIEVCISHFLFSFDGTLIPISRHGSRLLQLVRSAVNVSMHEVQVELHPSALGVDHRVFRPLQHRQRRGGIFSADLRQLQWLHRQRLHRRLLQRL